MTKRDEGLTQFPGFKGLRNNVPPEDFEVGDLVAAPNMHILDSGAIEARQGNSVLKVTGARHSVFAYGQTCLVVGGSTLYRLDTAYAATVLRTDMAVDRPVSYEQVAGRVYYTNGAQSGVVEADFTHRTFGLEVPAQPLASQFPGSLRPGIYQFALTYRRNDGQESGAMNSSSINVVNGIQFSGIPIPTDPTVVSKVLYLSKCNGPALFEYAVLPVTATTAMAVEDKPGLRSLKTQNLDKPPAGDLIARYKGSMLIVSGDTIYPSEPYAYEIFDRRKGIHLPGKINAVACMTDGVYCGTDDLTVWLSGNSPESFQWEQKADYGIVRGSLAFAPGSETAKESGNSYRGANGRVAFWMSTLGTVCSGADGGQFRDLSIERFTFPVGERSAALVRRHRGMHQYLGVTSGVVTAGNSFN